MENEILLIHRLGFEHYHDLEAVFLVGLICGLLGCLSRSISDGKNRRKNTFSFKNLAIDTLYSLCVSFVVFMLLSVFNEHLSVEFKVGVAGLIGLLGLDKSLEYLEKILETIKRGTQK